ncbi:MAG: GDP-mannose 4,6-dehydratase [Candidatus Andersenbacteria bacterium]|nr:GDP-mannose 4,6-dehydratase [Candidatus Andersenbacteria bacterium]
MAKILITGGAGFIGAHAAKALVTAGENVTILDDFNDFLYPSGLKQARIATFFTGDTRPKVIAGSILDAKLLQQLFTDGKFDQVVHLAAHANPGVSVDKGDEYTLVNVLGTFNILRVCHEFDVVQLVMAGSSSVYNDEQTPFTESSYPLKPHSPYGASKAAAEIYCEMWSDLHGLPTTVLRFFSVYGPWGRPDMAPFILAQQLLNDETIFLSKDRQRDFTYIDDVVAGILLALERKLDFEVINLGRGEPVDLRAFVAALEAAAGKKAHIVDRDAPPGEMRVTFANIEKAKKLLGYEPKVSVEEGTKKLVDWLKDFEK